MSDHLKKEVSDEEYQQRIAKRKIVGACFGVASAVLYFVGSIVAHFLYKSKLP